MSGFVDECLREELGIPANIVTDDTLREALHRFSERSIRPLLVEMRTQMKKDVNEELGQFLQIFDVQLRMMSTAPAAQQTPRSQKVPPRDLSASLVTPETRKPSFDNIADWDDDDDEDDAGLEKGDDSPLLATRHIRTFKTEIEDLSTSFKTPKATPPTPKFLPTPTPKRQIKRNLRVSNLDTHILNGDSCTLLGSSLRTPAAVSELNSPRARACPVQPPPEPPPQPTEPKVPVGSAPVLKSVQLASTLTSQMTDMSQASPQPISSAHRNRPTEIITSLDAMDRTPKGPRSCLTEIVRNPAFDRFVGCLVVLNAAIVSIQTDLVARRHLTSVPVMFQVSAVLFTLIFVCEIATRFLVHGFDYFRMKTWRWNILDCLLVGSQVIEQLLYSVNIWDESLHMNLTLIRLMRFLSIIRIWRTVRVLSLITELRTLVTSIHHSLRSLAWTAVLLGMMVLIISVFFTQVVNIHRTTSEKDPQQLQLLLEYYGSLGCTALTLFGSVTGGVDWRDALIPLMRDVSPLLAVIFVLYVIFAVFMMMNIITGVFVDLGLRSAREDKDFFMINNVRELFEDTGSLTLTRKEFENQMGKYQMQEYFKAIDVHPSEAKRVFRLLDMDDSGQIDATEFLDGCLRLRGPAKALDLAMLQHEVLWLCRRFHKFERWLDVGERKNSDSSVMLNGRS